MADNQQHYPDSNGARWEAPTTGGHPGQPGRPAFLNRTEPMSRQDRDAHAGDPSLSDALGGRGRISRLPSQEPGEHPTGGYAAQPPQWSPETAPAAPPVGGEATPGDPELAAVSGMEAPRQVPPPMPPQLGESAPRPPAGQPPQQPVDLNGPTQMHNPVSSAPPAQQQPNAYPQQGGVYQSNKSGLGPLVWVGAIVVALPILYVMVRSLTSGADVILSGAVASGMFALAGLPLTAYGLQASLADKPGPEGVSPLRAPYVYLVIGLVLILAAGMAAG